MIRITRDHMNTMEDGTFACYLPRTDSVVKFGIYTFFNNPVRSDICIRSLVPEIQREPLTSLNQSFIMGVRILPYAHPKEWPLESKFFLLSEEELIEHVLLETI